MNACAMVARCQVHQMGEEPSGYGTHRGDEHAYRGEFIPATDQGFEGVNRNLDTEAYAWSG